MSNTIANKKLGWIGKGRAPRGIYLQESPGNVAGEVVSKSVGLVPKNAFESFIDVDGEFLLDRLLHLVDVSIEHQFPILFQ